MFKKSCFWNLKTIYRILEHWHSGIVHGYSSLQCNLPHRYGNSFAMWDHTMLPATRQRWHSHLYPSWSWYSIKWPQRDARLSRPIGWLHAEIIYPIKVVTGPTCINFVHVTNSSSHAVCFIWRCGCSLMPGIWSRSLILHALSASTSTSCSLLILCLQTV